MNEFAIYLVRSAACLALLYAIYRAVFRRVNHPALRRRVLVISALLSLVMPLVRVEFTRDFVVSEDAPADYGIIHSMGNGSMGVVAFPYASSDAERRYFTDDGINFPAGKIAGKNDSWNRFPVSLRKMVTAVYFTGAAVVLAGMIMSILSLYFIKGRKYPIGRKGKVLLIITEGDMAPVSWFRRVYMSRNDFSENRRHILMHELEHVRLHHSPEMLASGLLVALQWFNPFAWMFRRELSAVHEYEVDRSMIEKNIDVIQYVQLMLQKATGLKFTMMNGFHHSVLKDRITMITKKKSSGRAVWYALYIIPFVCSATVAFARWTDVPVMPGGIAGSGLAPDGSVPAVYDTLSDRVFSAETVVGKGEYAAVFLPRSGSDLSSPAVLKVMHGQYKPGHPGEEECTVDNLVETIAATDTLRRIAIFCYLETPMGILEDVMAVLSDAYPDCSLTVQRDTGRKVTRLFADDVSGICLATFFRPEDTDSRWSKEKQDRTVIVRCNDDNIFFIAWSDSYLVSSDPDEVIGFCEKSLSEAEPGRYDMMAWGCDRTTLFGVMDKVLSWFHEKGMKVEEVFPAIDTSDVMTIRKRP